MQHAQNMMPNLFAHNENIAHIMPCVTTHAVTSCAHCAACTSRQAGYPNYTWHARNYLWTCSLHRPNNIYKKSSRDVREWLVTQDLKFFPSAVVGGSFIKTAMTCSHTGGMEGGAEGVINVGMFGGGLVGW